MPIEPEIMIYFGTLSSSLHAEGKNRKLNKIGISKMKNKNSTSTLRASTPVIL